ncbi:hypothetical protein GOP47_0027959 [Adiantum capillus-veneris]|nr:hypothetical protein GOP47_0027959 [Adiantum capillus-veneris]
MSPIAQPAALKCIGAVIVRPRNKFQGAVPAEEDHLQATAPLPHLDVLWHYDCVIGPPPARALISQARADSPATSTDANPSTLPAAGATPLSLASPHRPQISSLDDHKNHVQRHVLSRVFNTFDHNRDGRVSTHEISGIFHRLGIVPQTQDCIQSLLARLATKCDGQVDEQEFCLLFDSVCSSTTITVGENSAGSANADVDQDLLAAFHVFDKDGNGFISPSERQSVLCSLGFPQGRQLDACVEMIARVDENGDGQVDFLEFKKLFDLENASLLPVSSF